MAEQLTNLFSALAPLWEMSLTAAFAAAVVLVLRLLLKRRAPRQVVCLLWLIVFARLLIPFSLESPVSLVPQALTEGSTPAASQTVQPPVQDPIPTPEGNQSPSAASPAVGTQAPVISSQVPTAEPQVPLATPDAQPFPWKALAAGVWLLGAAAMLLYGIFSYVRLRRRVFDAVRAEDGAWEHPAVRSPFILGLFRPKIYLPAGLSGPARQFILCHERAHLKRLDYIVKPVCWLALALHWFNPMAWAAFLLMSRDMEVACDQAVIRRLGDGVKADYSATLLSLATGGKFPAPCPLAFGEGDAKSRIKSVLSYKKPALWIIVAAMAVAVIAAVCLLTDPKSPAAEDPEPSSSPSAQPEPTLSAGPDGYVTYSYYPGLYFLEETGDNGSPLTTAYRLNGGEPELVGSYQGYPGSDENCAMFEQLLVDTCAALDPNWADTLPTERTGSDAEGFMYLASVDGITLFSTPQWNTLLRYGDRLQVLAQQPYGAHGTAPGLQWADLDGDGQNELAVIYKELATGTHQSIDALVVYEWDGARWTAHPHDLSAAIERATDSMAYAVNRSAGTCSAAVLGLHIELELDPNALEQWDRLFDSPYELYLEPSYSYQYGFSAGGGFSLALQFSLMPGSRDNLAMCSDVFHLIYQVQYRPDGAFSDSAADIVPTDAQPITHTVEVSLDYSYSGGVLGPVEQLAEPFVLQITVPGQFQPVAGIGELAEVNDAGKIVGTGPAFALVRVSRDYVLDEAVGQTQQLITSGGVYSEHVGENAEISRYTTSAGYDTVVYEYHYGDETGLPRSLYAFVRVAPEYVLHVSLRNAETMPTRYAILDSILAKTYLSAVFSAYRAVLENTAAFTSGGGSMTDFPAGLQLTLTQAVTTYLGGPLIPARFSLVDLDQSGTPELVLLYTVGNGGTYLILRYDGGTVYGSTIYGRGFNELKADGSFSFSGSAAEGGSGRIFFTGDTYNTTELSNSDYNTMTFTIGGFQVTQAEFERFQQLQAEKEDVQWYPFTAENIAAVLSS